MIILGALNERQLKATSDLKAFTDSSIGKQDYIFPSMTILYEMTTFRMQNHLIFLQSDRTMM